MTKQVGKWSSVGYFLFVRVDENVIQIVGTIGPFFFWGCGVSFLGVLGGGFNPVSLTKGLLIRMET